ncbi:MAG: Lactonase, 7-bladed beta-propeller [Candidatus Eremiobacteraeota bacterium]|nr:Lactonase, 7-bladed beta-propeller [Candidatus Eremiobacteraeota bacterium]
MNRLRALAVAAVALCAGCGGAQLSSALPPAASANPGSSSVAAAGRSTVVFAIKVPVRPAAARGRFPPYLSPTASSVAIAIDDGANQLTATQSVAAGAAGCTPPAPASPPVCSVVFAVAPGEHRFSFTTYDEVLDRTGKPQGAVRARNAGIPFTVAPNAPATVNVSLLGAAKSIAVFPGARQDVQGTQQSGFDVYGVYKADGVTPFDRTFTAVATDAAGAFVLGMNAPLITLTSSDPNTFSDGAAAANDANTFTLSAVSYNSKRLELAIAAAPTDPSAPGAAPAGVHVPLRIVARNAPRIYVMDHLTENVGKVWVFDEDGNHVRVGGAFASLNGGIGIAYDKRLNRLYVSSEFSNGITVYDPEGNTITTTGTFPNLYFPLGLYVDDANGRVYAGNFNGGIDNQSDGNAGAAPCNVPHAAACGVTVYDEEGHQLPVAGKWREHEGVVPYLPYGVLADASSGRVYLTDAGYNRTEAYDANGRALFSWPTGAGARGIAQDAASKDLYVADDAACVSRYDQQGLAVSLPAGGCSGRDPALRDTGAFPNVRGPIAVRQNPANGWFYVANYANDSITAYDRDGNQMALRGNNLNGGPFGFNGSSGVVHGPIAIEVVP